MADLIWTQDFRVSFARKDYDPKYQSYWDQGFISVKVSDPKTGESYGSYCKFYKTVDEEELKKLVGEVCIAIIGNRLLEVVDG